MHRVWQKSYYPAALPPEWRYTFYSHRQSSVLIPGSAWRRAPDLLSVWREETPPGFRPVLELPLAYLSRQLPAAATDGGWLGGCLVRASRGLSAGDISRILEISRQIPVAVDVVCGRARAAPALLAAGIGVCGRPAEGWAAQGPFAVSLLGACDRKALRVALESLQAVSAPAGCGLFFTDPQTALVQIREARLLADLMQMMRPAG